MMTTIVDYLYELDTWYVYIDGTVDKQKGEVITFGARPGNGKTNNFTDVSLAIQFAMEFGLENDEILIIKTDIVGENVVFTEDQYMIINDQTDIVEALLRFA
jgi:hypothetical protein